jgi:hypothetical protein
VDRRRSAVGPRAASWLPLVCVLGASVCGMQIHMAEAADAGGVRYWARGLPTGLDRRIVFKSDPTRKLCLALTLVRGGAPPGFPVDVTPPWKVEKVAAWFNPDCDAAQISPADALARSASGTIRLRAEGNQCVIDLDVSATFEPKPPHLRAQESMVAKSVPIVSTRPPCR